MLSCATRIAAPTRGVDVDRVRFSRQMVLTNHCLELVRAYVVWSLCSVVVVNGGVDISRGRLDKRFFGFAASRLMQVIRSENIYSYTTNNGNSV